ncbi:MAG: ribosomal protein L16, partial [Bdellovibrionales bacterium]|nr:ribosomal protein L16 [Bdellovibrionales bacterium]
ADVRAGRILYEITGIEGALAREALERAAAKLPVRTEIVQRSDYLL